MKRFAISFLAGFMSGIIGLKLVSSVYQSIVHPGIQSTDGFLDIGAVALTGFVFVGLAGFLLVFKITKRPNGVK
jgi:hypothetical protein